MNGIALLLITATLGVEYTWRTTDDGQIEYVVIVEQDHISGSLAQGDQISSSVPPELESLQRLCIRIAQPAKNGIAPQPAPERKLPVDAFRNSRLGLRGAEPMTLLWKAQAQQPEPTTLVHFGWQPTKEGQLEYFVQIDPKLLRTLAPGDEIHATLASEAGQIDTFVVFSSTKQLPKVPGKPLAAPLAKTTPPNSSFAPSFAPLPATSPPAAPNAFNAPPLAPAASSTTFGPPTTGFNPGPTATSTGFNDKPPYAPPRTFGVTDDPLNDPNASRVNPATNYGPAAPAATDHVRGFNWENSARPDATRPDMTRPNLNTPGLNSTGLNNAGLNNGGLNNNGLNPPLNPPYRNDTYAANGARDSQLPNSSFPSTTSSYGNNDLYPNSNYASNQNNGNLRPGSQLPAAGNAPYRPSVGGYPQDNNVAANGYNNPNLNNQHQPNPNLPNPNYAQNPQAVDYRPMTGDNQMASLPTANNLRPGMQTDLKTGMAGALGTPTVAAEKPWWPLVFISFFALISFGANLYLGWTAAEFYSRYRLAVERLRTSGTRA